MTRPGDPTSHRHAMKDGVFFLSKRTLTLALAALALLGGTACSEKIENGAACPALCPNQEVPLRDTVLLEPLALDTTISGIPPMGEETALPVTRLGDSVDTRAVFRFDSLPSLRAVHRDTNGVVLDTATLVRVDSAALVVTLDTAKTRVPGGATLYVYDVDTASASDTAVAPVDAAFAPGRLLDSVVVDSARLADTTVLRHGLRVPLPSSFVLARLQRTDSATRRIRLGLRLGGTTEGLVTLDSRNGGTAAVLRYIPSFNADSAGVPRDSVTVPLSSRTPEGDPLLRNDLADYVFAHAQPAPPAGTLRVGGIPGKRVYLRFALPAFLNDPARVTIIRASLVLHQMPGVGMPGHDTLQTIPQMVTASRAVKDVSQASHMLADPVPTWSMPFDTLPALTGGARRVEMANVARYWAATDTLPRPRAIVLWNLDAGATPTEVRFYSTEAPVDSLRPRLEIIYVPSHEVGLP